MRRLVGPTFTFSRTVVRGFFSASFIGMKRPVSALRAFSTVRAIVDFLLLSGDCEGLPKVFGLDIGLGYPFFINAIYMPTRQKMTECRCLYLNFVKIKQIFKIKSPNKKNVVSLHRHIKQNDYDSGIQNQELLLIA